jgi:hypothetical protein
MPREQFDKKITAANPITEPKVIAQLKAIITQLDTSRPWDEWTNDELLAYRMYPNIRTVSRPSLWPGVGWLAIIAFGIPLAVLVL